MSQIIGIRGRQNDCIYELISGVVKNTVKNKRWRSKCENQNMIQVKNLRFILSFRKKCVSLHHKKTAIMSTLYSIGHGNKSFEEFEEELRSFGIQYLIDVRSKPYSKWNPTFNQEALRALLQKRGFVYVYMGDTIGGMPTDSSCYTDGHIDYAKLREKPFFQEGFARLLTAAEKELKVAVMCSESEPEKCHRSKLIGQELLKHGISMNHIVGVGKSQSQETVMAILTKGAGTMTLFGEETFVSRKSYS